LSIFAFRLAAMSREARFHSTGLLQESGRFLLWPPFLPPRLPADLFRRWSNAPGIRPVTARPTPCASR